METEGESTQNFTLCAAGEAQGGDPAGYRTFLSLAPAQGLCLSHPPSLPPSSWEGVSLSSSSTLLYIELSIDLHWTLDFEWMRMWKEREGVLLLWQPHVELNDVSNSNTPLQCDVRKAGVSNSPASLEEGDLSSCSSAAALVHWCREVKVTVSLSHQTWPRTTWSARPGHWVQQWLLSWRAPLYTFTNHFLTINTISLFSKAVVLFLPTECEGSWSYLSSLK